MKMGRRIGQIGGKQEKNDTKELKRYESSREGMVNGPRYCKGQVNKEWNIHSTWLLGGARVSPFSPQSGKQWVEG